MPRRFGRRGIEANLRAVRSERNKPQTLKDAQIELGMYARAVLFRKGALIFGIKNPSQGIDPQHPAVYVVRGTPPVKVNEKESIVLRNPSEKTDLIDLLSVSYEDDKYFAHNYNNKPEAHIGSAALFIEGINPINMGHVERIRSVVADIDKATETLEGVPNFERLIKLPHLFVVGGPKPDEIIDLLKVKNIPSELLVR